MSVYKAINAVQAALSRTGIAKDRTNTQGAGYKFRGIDDVYNAVAPLLAEHGLCVLPRVIARECVERQSKNGGALFYVTVEAEFDFVCAEDGSKHTVKTFGEAMDSGDKATNKAMSAAYKYAAFQAFAIPTEGDNDADAHTHEVAPRMVHKPTDGAWDRLDETQQMHCQLVASIIEPKFEKEGIEPVCDLLDKEDLDNDMKLGLWHLLADNSKLRNAIKKEQEKRRLGGKAQQARVYETAETPAH